MSSWKRTTITFLMSVSMIIALCVPVKAEAANPYEFKKITAGTWTTTSWNDAGGTWHNTFYTISVPAAGELKFALNADSKNTSPSVYVYDLKKDIIDSKATGAYINNSSVVKSVAVDKGTYYLRVTGNVRVTYIKAVNKPNYSMSTAINLKENTSVKVVQTPFDNYSRWYKIRITGKKRICYWSNTVEHANEIGLYNSRGQRVKSVKIGSTNRKYRTEQVQAPGTYYLRVPSYYVYDTDYFRAGEIYTLNWQ